MDTFLAACVERFSYLHKEVGILLESVPPESLDWKPYEEMNSITVLVTHMTSSTRYWIGAVASGEQSKRVRESEFEASAISKGELTVRVNACLSYVVKRLEAITIDDLSKSRHADRFGRDFTIGWCILHALEHFAQHVGHLDHICCAWRNEQNTLQA